MRQKLKLFFKYDLKVDETVNAADLAETDKEQSKLDRAEEKFFNKACEYFSELTTKEQRSIPIDVRKFYQ